MSTFNLDQPRLYVTPIDMIRTIGAAPREQHESLCMLMGWNATDSAGTAHVLVHMGPEVLAAIAHPWLGQISKQTITEWSTAYLMYPVSRILYCTPSDLCSLFDRSSPTSPRFWMRSSTSTTDSSSNQKTSSDRITKPGIDVVETGRLRV